MRVPLATIPLELRAERARDLISAGADPHLTLAAALWPDAVAVFDSEPTLNADGFCKRGHPWTQENTYYRKDGNKWKKCRQCAREKQAVDPSRKSRSRHRKVPCTYCGNPCTVGKGQTAPRCRACFIEQGGWWARTRRAT